MQLMKKIKARSIARDAITKLTYLKKEVVNGNASEADLAYWDESLIQLEEASILLPNYTNRAQLFQRYRDVLQIKVNYSKDSERTEPYVVISSIRGDISLLERHLKELRQEGDCVVVLGDFLPAGVSEETTRSFIKLLMGYAKEGVIFLRGKTEEGYAEKTKNSDEVEDLLIQVLPDEWETFHFVFPSEDTMPIKSLLTVDNFPNITDKFVVGNYNGEEGANPSEYYYKEEQKTIGMPDGFATRLEIK